MSQKHEYFGKYILLERLAAGGMAEVWLARAPGAGGIGKFVAIKKILSQYSDNPEFIQMFRDEAAIAMHLSHSNIVSIYEFGQEKQQLFLVLDYVEGRNLRQILNKMKSTKHRFSIDQICYIAKEVAAGLDHAHRCLDSSTGKPLNITHRDMSPQNVMVSFEGEVKIIDFGIAKAANQLEATKTGTLKGKFGYMSPEQADGNGIDLRTDIFSLGIALWELLANDRLFIANNELNTLRKIRECKVPSLTKLNPNIDPELERIVMKSLTRDRNLRYQTAAAMHRDLNRFLNRHYPDFTPHDFAVFIKTVYADEILQTRKRLIDYSRIPFRNHNSNSLQDIDDRTQTQTDIDKTVVTSFEQKDSLSENTEAIEDTNDGWLTGNSPPTITDSEASYKKGPQGITVTDTKTFSDKDGSTNSNILNISAIKNVFDMATSYQQNNDAAPKKRKQKVNEFNSDNSSSLNLENVDERPQRSTSKTAIRKRKKAAPVKKETPAVVRFALSVVAGICIYLVMMNMFPQQTQQLEGEAHKALQNLVNQQQNAAMQEPESTNVPMAEQIPAPKAQAPVQASSIKLIVQSVPSGAEIFIDGESTGEYTPARVDFPFSKNVDITLKKDRYIDYSMANFNADTYDQSSLRATLQKEKLGYLDIDVRPSRNINLYINNRKLSENSLPIFKYAIPANSNISVKAVHQITGETVERSISLYEDERKSVILQMNQKGSRTPSSY